MEVKSPKSSSFIITRSTNVSPPRLERKKIIIPETDIPEDLIRVSSKSSQESDIFARDPEPLSQELSNAHLLDKTKLVNNDK